MVVNTSMTHAKNPNKKTEGTLAQQLDFMALDSTTAPVYTQLARQLEKKSSSEESSNNSSSSEESSSSDSSSE